MSTPTTIDPFLGSFQGVCLEIPEALSRSFTGVPSHGVFLLFYTVWARDRCPDSDPVIRPISAFHGRPPRPKIDGGKWLVCPGCVQGRPFDVNHRPPAI